MSSPMMVLPIASLLAALMLISGIACEEKPIRAVVVLTGTGTVRGNVTFAQKGCGEPVLTTVYVAGLTPNGQFGFHVHEKGDLLQHCTSLGAHYNPDKVEHGSRSSEVRHVGDLGNLKADANGIAETTFSDDVISLTGNRSIIGRGVIVHEGVDDYGLGGHPDSKKTGNAGGRAACGVIGIVLEEHQVLPQCPSGAAGRMLSAVSLIAGLAILMVAHLATAAA